jgi:hypothetical protein
MGCQVQVQDVSLRDTSRFPDSTLGLKLRVERAGGENGSFSIPDSRIVGEEWHCDRAETVLGAPERRRIKANPS